MGFENEEHGQNNALQSNEEVENNVTNKGTKRKRKAYKKKHMNVINLRL